MQRLSRRAVFPFLKFPGVDTILGPEMKSTGEVMGVGATFAEAFVKSQLAASVKLPKDAGATQAEAFEATRPQLRVGMTELEEARDKVRWGRAKKSRVVDQKEREITAYHEAGHAIVVSMNPSGTIMNTRTWGYSTM